MPDIDDKLAGLAREANEAHSKAQDCFKRGAEHAMVSGTALLTAKARVKHGAWGPWLERNFEGSARTAQLYMRLARHIRDLDEETRKAVADLSLRQVTQSIAKPRTIRLVVHEEETRPVPIKVAASEPEPLAPRRPVPWSGPAAGSARRLTDPRRLEASEAAEPATLDPGRVAITHVRALLAGMRATKPAEFAAAVAVDAIFEPKDLEELESWLSDAASEVNRLGKASRPAP